MRTLIGVAALFFTMSAVGPSAADDTISLDEWVSLTNGKTVHYAVDGRPAGREYYPQEGGFAVFEAPDGSCVEGPWAHDGGRFCFWYGSDFQCFFHMRRGSTIVSQSDTGGQEQVIEKITDNEPLHCAPG